MAAPDREHERDVRAATKTLEEMRKAKEIIEAAYQKAWAGSHGCW